MFSYNVTGNQYVNTARIEIISNCEDYCTKYTIFAVVSKLTQRFALIVVVKTDIYV